MQRENPGNETGYRSAPAYKLTKAENTIPYHNNLKTDVYGVLHVM